jgi:2-dehydro-3-deoxyphosphogluconate aldolase / (4S)-4-hydroxy-2-oxoglutarate aldolase
VSEAAEHTGRRTPDEVADSIHRARILPVVRATSAERAAAMVSTLVTARAGAVEVTSTIPGWEDVLAAACSDVIEGVVGAGTITTAEQAERAIACGAEFLVSPHSAPAVRTVAATAGVLFIEGGFTPAEVADAAGRGPAKLFPAHVGGVSYLRSLLAVMPGARLIPTGGIPLPDVAQWLQAGAYAVGVGSDLFAGDVAERLAAIGLTGGTAT